MKIFKIAGNRIQAFSLATAMFMAAHNATFARQPQNGANFYLEACHALHITNDARAIFDGISRGNTEEENISSKDINSMLPSQDLDVKKTIIIISNIAPSLSKLIGATQSSKSARTKSAARRLVASLNAELSSAGEREAEALNRFHLAWELKINDAHLPKALDGKVRQLMDILDKDNFCEGPKNLPRTPVVTKIRMPSGARAVRQPS